MQKCKVVAIAKADKKVCLIDLDRQADLTACSGGKER